MIIQSHTPQPSGDRLAFGIAGAWLGAKVFTPESRIFKMKYLTQTEQFYAKYGGKTGANACSDKTSPSSWVGFWARMHRSRTLANGAVAHELKA
jgi:hypothetical protein